MNFYKRYIGDYQRDTAHLSLMEHGAYTLLLDATYATGKAVPADLEALYRICRAVSKAERAAVASVASQFFPVNGDGSRHNRRADIEIGKYGEQAETNRAIAVERERKRKEHGQSTNRATTDSTNDQPKPETRNQKVHTRAGARSRKTPLPDNFGLSDRVIAWAEEHGISNLEAHFKNFVGVARAKGYTYASWDDALMNAVRNDWAKLGAGEKKVAL